MSDKKKDEKLEIRMGITKLILAEGIDGKLFFDNLIGNPTAQGIQVFDFGGIVELTLFIKNLTGK